MGENNSRSMKKEPKQEKNSVKIYSYEVGQTLGKHEEFLQQLTKRGAVRLYSLQDSDVIIVFCPIISRFESDVDSAIGKTQELGEQDGRTVILVAMHHTYKPDYTLPDTRVIDHPVDLAVDCLFHEKKGFLNCRQNERACDIVCNKLGLQEFP